MTRRHTMDRDGRPVALGDLVSFHIGDRVRSGRVVRIGREGVTVARRGRIGSLPELTALRSSEIALGPGESGRPS